MTALVRGDRLHPLMAKSEKTAEAEIKRNRPLSPGHRRAPLNPLGIGRVPAVLAFFSRRFLRVSFSFLALLGVDGELHGVHEVGAFEGRAFEVRVRVRVRRNPSGVRLAFSSHRSVFGCSHIHLALSALSAFSRFNTFSTFINSLSALIWAPLSTLYLEIGQIGQISVRSVRLVRSVRSVGKDPLSIAVLQCRRHSQCRHGTCCQRAEVWRPLRGPDTRHARHARHVRHAGLLCECQGSVEGLLLGPQSHSGSRSRRESLSRRQVVNNKNPGRTAEALFDQMRSLRPHAWHVFLKTRRSEPWHFRNSREPSPASHRPTMTASYHCARMRKGLCWPCAGARAQPRLDLVVCHEVALLLIELGQLLWVLRKIHEQTA